MLFVFSLKVASTPDVGSTSKRVVDLIYAEGVRHGDLTPRNIIYDGTSLYPIDMKDHWNPLSKSRLQCKNRLRKLLAETKRHLEKDVQ